MEKKLEMLSKKNEKNEQNLKKQAEELELANKVSKQTLITTAALCMVFC